MKATSPYPTHDAEECRDVDALRRRLREMEARLREAEETILAIHSGDVDAIVVQAGEGAQVYTLDNDDRPYRRLIEQIGEGALTLTPDGTVLYCNGRLAALLGVPQERVIGRGLRQMIAASDHALVEGLLEIGEGRGSVALLAADGSTVAVHLSLTELVGEGERRL